MTESEPNHSPLEKHMLGLSMVHPTYLFEKPSLSSRISSWTLMLVEFDIKYVTTMFVRGKVVAEYMSNLVVEFGGKRDFLFPDEGVMEIKKDI